MFIPNEYAYRKAQQLEAEDVSFYALILAAMRRGDTNNVGKLRAAWPEVWNYLVHRYNCTTPPCLCKVCLGAHTFKYTAKAPPQGFPVDGPAGPQACHYCGKPKL